MKRHKTYFAYFVKFTLKVTEEIKNISCFETKFSPPVFWGRDHASVMAACKNIPNVVIHRLFTFLNN